MSSDTGDLLCLDLPQAEAGRAQLAGEGQVRALADQAKAFGDPTRLRIASALQLGEELCVCDLAWITELSQNLVSTTCASCGRPASPRPDATASWSCVASPRPAPPSH